jgi:hypothetical protein
MRPLLRALQHLGSFYTDSRHFLDYLFVSSAVAYMYMCPHAACQYDIRRAQLLEALGSNCFQTAQPLSERFALCYVRDAALQPERQSFSGQGLHARW